LSWFQSEEVAAETEEAREILENGELMEATENLCYIECHNDEWARRCARATSLLLAGQLLKRTKDGERLYSHLGLYQPHGLGRGYFLKWLTRKTSVIPRQKKDMAGFRIAVRDSVTEAALMGSLTAEGEIKPSPLLADVIVVEEYASLLSKDDQELAASIRRSQEDGVFSRDLLKFRSPAAVFHQADEARAVLSNDKITNQKIIADAVKALEREKNLNEQLAKWKRRGLYLNVALGRMTIYTNTSWIISSATFGATLKSKPLLELGDLDRYIWVSSLLTLTERRDVVEKVALYPPRENCPYEPEAVSIAWRWLYGAMLKYRKQLEIPATKEDYDIRLRYWRETINSAQNEYADKIKPDHLEQFLTKRYAMEWIRTAYQHATFVQFKRNPDFMNTDAKFILVPEEDYQFARDMFLAEYLPSFIEIIDDVQKGWIGFKARKEELEKRKEERAKNELTVMLNAFKVLGKSDVEIKELHKVVCQVDKPIEYVTFWIRVKKLVARGFLEHEPAHRGQAGRVKLTERGVEELKNMSSPTAESILASWGRPKK